MLRDEKEQVQAMKKLKRCPFCNTYFGGKTLWHSVTARWWERKYNIECNYCKWNGEKARTKRGAVRKWNRDKGRDK